MSFQDIIGHSDIKNEIINSIKHERFAHAHIISGEDGIGKSLIAKEAAFKLLNKKSGREYADIIEFRLLKNKKSIGVEELKSIIREINTKPYEGDKKVIIIHNADSMTVEAQNAFLKTVEEPPKGIFILLLCEKVENLLDTIKSRCQIYKLHHLYKEDMEEFLLKKYSYLDKKELNSICVISDCIPGRAERFMEDSELKDIRNLTLDILVNITDEDVDIFNYEEMLLKYRSNWEETLTWFLSYIRDALIYKETGNNNIIVNIDKMDGIKGISEIFSFTQLNDIIDIIKDTRLKLESNVNAALVFDSMLLKMQEV
ncbi:DNA polymerase III subunit delta' [Clostridium lundense]|uniref:DNA polymerase III subunit delta' n=1 Tax=Clostridium lundense TaxID=319475 RepID=UPI0004835A05|nr:DNA polymerase III subunit delta' [Clostridium lundense]